MTLLGGLTPRAFLHRHWQKTPCLIRKAVPGFIPQIPQISPNELAGLACEETVGSRLIIKIRTLAGWRVRHGPFKKADFRTLPARNWTLLVQDTDKHLPTLAGFLDNFRFIPSWRIDDLMVSYATDGGSVGAHVDAYDVFLLQAQGRRRWAISSKPQRKAHQMPGLELQQVCAFKPQHTWVLEPGDMLYLPPGVAHHGVAIGECMTFSIGCRAPTDAEMLADLSSLLLERTHNARHYSDPDLAPATSDPGLISEKLHAAIRRRLRSALHPSDAELDDWFGRFITESKSWLSPIPARRPLATALLRQRLASGRGLVCDLAMNMAWCHAKSHTVKLFVNGHCQSLPTRLSGLAQLLCGHRHYATNKLKFYLIHKEAVETLADLYNMGMLHFQ